LKKQVPPGPRHKETDWKQYHASKQTQANEVAANLQGQANYLVVLATGTTIPALPTFPNPGRFNLDENWTDKERAVKKIIHEQKADAYLLASNVDKALVMLIK
jgi:hypothetical protein